MDRQQREINLHKEIVKDYVVRDTHPNGVYYNKVWTMKMLKLVPTINERILDYGCGTGNMFPFIINQGPNFVKYIGIDISEEMIQFAKSKYPEAQFIVASGYATTLEDNSVDTVIGKGIIHHLSNHSDAIKEIKRVLTNKGYLVLSEPISNPIIDKFRNIAKKKTTHFDDDHYPIIKKQFIELLEQNGFKIIKVRHFGYLAFPFGLPDVMKSLSKLPLFLMKCFVFIDKVISIIPGLNKLSWHVIFVAEVEKDEKR